MSNNQKVYKIIINGIEESVKDINLLIAKLGELDIKIQELSQKTISVNVKSEVKSVSTSSSSSGDESKITSEKREQLIIEQQIKEEKRQEAQYIKDIVQGVRDENGEYSNTLAGLRRQLSDMKKELANMDLDDSGWDAMRQKVAKLNDAVKEVEQSYGVFNRNVGNYKSAADGFGAITSGANEANQAINALASKKISIDIGGVKTEFNSFKEATKTLNGELNQLALAMRQLEQEGKTTSAEYQQLKQRFNDVAEAADELNHASEAATRMKNSIQDDSGAVGELARTFDSFTSIAQVGTGVMGLFGQSSEDTTEAINRTVQVMTTLKGIQELVNKHLQTGAPLMNMYQGAVNKLTGALTTEAASATAASTATRAFSKALISTGIGAIIVAIGTAVAYLTDNWEDLKKEFIDLFPWLGNIGEGFNKMISIVKGVGSVIVNNLLTPLRVFGVVLRDIMNGDFSKIADDVGAALKKGYDVVGNFNKAYDKSEKKRREAKLKEQKKANNEELKYQLDMLKAKEGNDAQYSKKGQELQEQYWKNRLEIAKNGTKEEQREARLGYEQYKGDLKRHNEQVAKQKTDAAKKSKATAQKQAKDEEKEAKEKAKELLEIEKKIASNTLSAMKDGHKKELAQLKMQWAEELKEAETVTQKREELVKSINIKYQAEEMKLRKDYQAKLDKFNNDVRMAEIDSVLEFNELQMRRLDYIRSLVDKITALADDTVSPLDALDNSLTKAFEPLDKLDEKSDEIYQFTKNTKKNIDEVDKDVKEGGKSIVSSFGMYWNQLKSWVSSRTIVDTLKNNLQHVKEDSITALEATRDVAKGAYEGMLSQENEEYKKSQSAFRDYAKERLEEYKSMHDTIDSFTSDFIDNIEKYYKFSYDIEAESDEREKKRLESRLEGVKGQLESQVATTNSYMDKISRALNDEINEMYLKWVELNKNEKASFDDSKATFQKYVQERLQLYSASTLTIGGETIDLYSNMEDATSEFFEKLKNLEKDGYDTLEDLIQDFKRDLIKDANSGYDTVLTMYEDFVNRYETMTLNHNLKIAQIEEEQSAKNLEITEKQSQLLLNAYEKQYEELENIRQRYTQQPNTSNQDVDSLFNIAQQGAEYAKVGKAYKELLSLSQKEIENNNLKIKQIQEEIDKIQEKQKINKDAQNEQVKLMKDLENQIKEVEDEINKLDPKDSSVKTLFEQYNRQVIELKESLNDAQNEFEKLADKGNALEGQITNKKLEIFDLKKANQQLGDLASKLKGFLDGSFNDWKAWAKSIVELGAVVVDMWSQMFSQITEMQYHNNMKALEDKQKALEEEYDMLDEQYSKQEELYQKHNDRVNTIEDALGSARGDRRLALLEELNSEINAREKAWAQQQKIERLKEANEKKQKQIEKQKEAEEKKRNENQKKVQIAQATASTALAVVNALSLQPFYLGIAMAAVAAAMGAVQIATIANTKYAEGGLLDGKSHSQGGIKVGNTGIEVEGGEYVINKKTTKKNLALVEYINSKKTTITRQDLNEFFNGSQNASTPSVKQRFASGGQLQSVQTPTIDVSRMVSNIVQDDRPVVVSVVDINNAQARVRNIRTLAGDID